jgi:hypothetical protein
MTVSGRLSVRKRKAVEALLVEPTVRGAAAVAGISERTLRRWRNEPAFRLELRQAQDEAFGATLTALATLGPRAVTVLSACMEDGSEPAIRLRSAIAALELAVKAQSNDLADRIAELERLIGRTA